MRFLLSQIGAPISRPQLFDVKVRLGAAREFDVLAPRIVEGADTEFAKIDSIWRDAIDGTLRLW